MSIINRILHRGSGKQQNEEDNTNQAVFTNTAIATRHQPSAQEAENRRDKGIDIDMIDPEEITQEIQALAHFTYSVKVNKLVDVEGKAQIIAVDEPRVGTRPWAIAALGYLNKVWPTIWMTTFEADTTKLRIRTAFHDIRKAMSYEDKKLYGIVLKMVRDLCYARCEDMKEGHKPLLLKVKREELGVHMTRGPESGKIGAK
jgi:hypothetical protein